MMVGGVSDVPEGLVDGLLMIFSRGRKNGRRRRRRSQLNARWSMNMWGDTEDRGVGSGIRRELGKFLSQSRRSRLSKNISKDSCRI